MNAVDSTEIARKGTEAVTKPKLIEPATDEQVLLIKLGMHLRGDYRRRGVNLSGREVLSLIARIEATEGRTFTPPENVTGGIKK